MTASFIVMYRQFAHTVHLQGVKGPVPDLIAEDDVLLIINNKSLCANIRRPFVSYLLYLSLSRGTATLRSYVMHHKNMWSFIAGLSDDLLALQVYLENDNVIADRKLKADKISDDLDVGSSDVISRLHALLYYFVDAVLPLMTFIGDNFTPDSTKRVKETHKLTAFMTSLMDAAPFLAATFVTQRQLRQLVNALYACAETCDIEREVITDVITQTERNYTPSERRSNFDDTQAPRRTEAVLNDKLRSFVKNCQQLLERNNVVSSQLQVNFKVDPAILKKRTYKSG